MSSASKQAKIDHKQDVEIVRGDMHRIARLLDEQATAVLRAACQEPSLPASALAEAALTARDFLEARTIWLREGHRVVGQPKPAAGPREFSKGQRVA